MYVLNVQIPVSGGGLANSTYNNIMCEGNEVDIKHVTLSVLLHHQLIIKFP